MSTHVEAARPDDRHPLDSELVAYADGELGVDEEHEVEAHVSSCAVCSTILEQLSPAVDVGVADVEPYDLPQLVRHEATGEPVVGELWQLDWADSALLALVLEVGAEGYVVAAVTGVDDGSSEWTLPLASDLGSATGVELKVWPSIRRVVPLGSFANPVAAFGADIVGAIQEQAQVPAATWSEALEGTDLLVALDELSEARWVPDAHTVRPLRELMLEHDLTPAALSTLSGVPAAAITQLLRGVRKASEEEAERLSAVLGVPHVDLVEPLSFPAALVRAVERPVHRAAIRLRAIAEGTSEAAARLRVAENVLAMPARTTTQVRDVEAWDQLVRHHLDD